MTRWSIAAAAAAALAVALAADVALGSSTVGLTALTGLAGCAVLIIGSKALGSRVLQRPEDYYAAIDGVAHEHGHDTTRDPGELFEQDLSDRAAPRQGDHAAGTRVPDPGDGRPGGGGRG